MHAAVSSEGDCRDTVFGALPLIRQDPRPKPEGEDLNLHIEKPRDSEVAKLVEEQDKAYHYKADGKEQEMHQHRLSASLRAFFSISSISSMDDGG